MKDKQVAGFLSLFLGWLGVHRFYLSEPNRGTSLLLLTIIAAIFSSKILFGLAVIFGMLDAMSIFSMDNDEFDVKYNKKYYRTIRKKQEEQSTRSERRRSTSSPRREPPRHVKSAQFKALKNAGIKKFRDFDYQGAIKDFEKALNEFPNDIALHFNLACAYSLNEDVEKAFYHIDKAVHLGFNDFDRIRNHDALAYLRIDPNFKSFEENDFRLSISSNEETLNLPVEQPNADEFVEESGDLLEEINRLQELRKKNLLSEEEFQLKKKQILKRGNLE